MDETLRTALRRAFDDAKCIDSDVIAHPTLAGVVAKVEKLEDIPGAVLEAKRLRPNWFASWQTMNDRDFDRAERDLRDGLRPTGDLRSQEADAMISAIRAIDASKLSKSDFEVLDRLLSSILRRDWSRVDPTEIARLQKAVA